PRFKGLERGSHATLVPPGSLMRTRARADESGVPSSWRLWSPSGTLRAPDGRESDMNRLLLVIALIAPAVPAANYGPGFQQKMVPVEGCTLSATTGGNGPTELLIHGYAETAHMWKRLAVPLPPRSTLGTLHLS